MSRLDRKAKHSAVHRRIRKKLRGTAERPRLAVHRSIKHTYCQAIDDELEDAAPRFRERIPDRLLEPRHERQPLDPSLLLDFPADCGIRRLARFDVPFRKIPVAGPIVEEEVVGEAPHVAQDHRPGGPLNRHGWSGWRRVVGLGAVGLRVGESSLGGRVETQESSG